MRNTESFPLVSVVIPCYNHVAFVKETIVSVINQDYQNIELIVIDDGSTDGSVEVIKELIPACKDRFVRFEFRNRPNKGLCETLNEAISWCSGLYLALFGSDDLMLGNRISSQVYTFQEKSKINDRLVAVYSGVAYIDKHGSAINVKAGSGRFCGFEEVILRSEFLPSPTFFVIREKIVEVGGFKKEFKVEDFYIRLKLADAGGVFYTDTSVLVKYRRHDDNLSKKSDLIWREVNRILSEYKDREIYKKALAFSMMVQAHDYQTVSNLKGIGFVVKAVKVDFSVLLSKSMLKFLVKIFYKPRY